MQTNFSPFSGGETTEFGRAPRILPQTEKFMLNYDHFLENMTTGPPGRSGEDPEKCPEPLFSDKDPACGTEFEVFSGKNREFPHKLHDRDKFYGNPLPRKSEQRCMP